MRRYKVIGITGNIACGKSTVAARLRRLGYPVIDADQVARDVVEPPSPTLKKLVKTFGREILLPSGQLDRARLRAVAFQNKQKRQKLESIMHPAIAREAKHQFQFWANKNKRIIFYEASLIVEAKTYKQFDSLIVVTSPIVLQKRRLLERRGITAALAQSMMDSQMKQSEKSKYADWVIRNNGDKNALNRAIAEVLREISLAIAT